MSNYKVNIGFITEEIGKEKIIFDGERSLLHSLNETSFFIFNLIKKGLNKEQIIKKVSMAYEIDSKTAEKDVSIFINKLLKQHIISETSEDVHK